MSLFQPPGDLQSVLRARDVRIETTHEGVHVFMPGRFVYDGTHPTAGPIVAAMLLFAGLAVGAALDSGVLVLTALLGAPVLGIVLGSVLYARSRRVPVGIRIFEDRAFVVSQFSRWECEVASLRIETDTLSGMSHIRVVGPTDGGDLFLGCFNSLGARQLAEYLQQCVAVSIRRDRGDADEVPVALSDIVRRD